MIRRLAGLATAGLVAAAPAQAARYCDEPPPLDAAQQSRLLRVASLVRAELAASGAEVALVARSGLDLARFGVRYSHAGLSLKASPATPWAVRQLYFACEERRPRLFDQGLPAFLMGMQSPALGYLSVLLLPGKAAAQVAQAALDKPTALQLLAADYSANAYPFNLRYQNCNQWVAELLASAWRGGETSRAGSQAWLQQQGYAPTLIEVGWPLMTFSTAIPWVHRDDHPEDDLQAARYRVSMPASLEDLARRHVPDTSRLEFCHTETHVVLRRGGPPIAEGCVPQAGDTVTRLD